MCRRFAAVSAAVAGVVLFSKMVNAGLVVDSVLSYSAGNLSSVPSEVGLTNPNAAVGPLTGDTGIGTPYGANGLNPFDPPFTPSQVVAVGGGGQLTLHLSQPLTTAGGPTLGVFVNNGLIDVSADGSGQATTPASTFDDPDYPTAIVSVSQDGTHFVPLNGGNPITFFNPTNYYTDSPISFYTQPLGHAVANQYQPFNGSIGNFNGSTYSQMLTTLNGSAGGTWLDLSSTGLSSVSAVQFSVPTGASYSMALDGLSGSRAIGNRLIWPGGSAWTSSKDGSNIIFDDTASSPSVTISGVVRPSTITFNNNGSTYTVAGSNSSSGIAGAASLTINGAGTVVLSSTNTYAGGTWVNHGQLVLTSVNAYPANTPLYVYPDGAVKLNQSTGPASVFVLSALSDNGSIDVTNNGIIVHNGAVDQVTAQAATGFNGGAWNGSSNSGAIVSSLAAADSTHLTAVGVATGLTSFEGSTVTTSDVLVKYTYFGDANLDGQVDGSDYSRIDNGYLSQSTMSPLTGWYNGDFNYDGAINGSDYTLLDNAFNAQGAIIAGHVAGPTAQVAVPEPAAAMLLACGSVALLARRRSTKRS